MMKKVIEVGPCETCGFRVRQSRGRRLPLRRELDPNLQADGLRRRVVNPLQLGRRSSARSAR